MTRIPSIVMWSSVPVISASNRPWTVSNSRRWADGAAFDFVGRHRDVRPKRIWISTGTEEGWKTGPLAQLSPAARDCRRLVDLLKEAGMRSRVDFRYEEIAGGKHNETTWARQSDEMLLYLFGEREAATSRPAEK